MTKPPDPPTKPYLSAQVTRSISAIKKKDMPDTSPSLASTDQAQIELWAKELLSQAGPKDGNLESYPAFFAQIPAVIRKIGTHGFKLPNPDVNTPPVFMEVIRQTRKLPGILCEGLLPETLIYSGDASQIRLAKFLLAKVTLDGIETCVINELIVGTESQVTATLIRCGVPATACDMASEFPVLRSQQDLKKLPIHPLTKQIYFEEEGKEDVLLIPVAPESLIAELHSQSQQPGRWLALRALCAIGGANPVNGGSLCSDIGGAFQLLQAEPPKFSDQTLQQRVARGGPVYTKYSVSNTDVLTFIHTAEINQTTGNKDKRDTERSAYQWFAQTMLAALLEADNMVIEQNATPEKETGGIADYLQRNHADQVSPELARDAANDVFDIVVKNNPSLRQHIADTHIRAMLIQQMVEVLL